MVATPPPLELVHRKAFKNDNRTGTSRTNGLNDTWWTLSDLKRKQMMLFQPPSLCLNELKCCLNGGRLIYALEGNGGILGRVSGPLPFLIIRIDVGLQEQYALRRKEHAYMSCTYTKISLTHNETSVCLFFPCVLRFASMTEGLTDACVCVDCLATWFKCYIVLLRWYNEMDDFYIGDSEAMSSNWTARSSNVH